jgi:cytochrome c
MKRITLSILLGGAVLAAMSAAAPAWAESETALAQSADAARGQALYESRCIGCHSLDENRIGPRHRGVFGRRAGSVEDFDYSKAVRASEIVWTAEALDRWLTNPQALIPGQRMNFRVAKPADRLDIIAYLKLESGG